VVGPRLLHDTFSILYGSCFLSFLHGLCLDSSLVTILYKLGELN
jgi:hypothetical protein